MQIVRKLFTLMYCSFFLKDLNIFYGLWVLNFISMLQINSAANSLLVECSDIIIMQFTSGIYDHMMEVYRLVDYQMLM